MLWQQAQEHYDNVPRWDSFSDDEKLEVEEAYMDYLDRRCDFYNSTLMVLLDIIGDDEFLLDVEDALGRNLDEEE